MSVLDKAFIKAFNKGANSDTARAEESSPQTQLPDTASSVQPIAPADSPDDASGDGPVHRIDQSLSAWTDQYPQPHIQFIPADGCEELEYVSPYHEICPPTFPDEPEVAEAVRETADAPLAAPIVLEAVSEDLDRTAREASSQCSETEALCVPEELPQATTAEPAQAAPIADAADSLRHAAAINLPAMLELPGVFQPSRDEVDDEQQADDALEFSPDWEVDRFVWPPVCEELLEAQSSYFQHVGSRLMAATQESDHVIMISSSRRGEGRTTLALCLARCAAEAGIKVAVVDADLQNPQLGTRLGMETPCSWLEVVTGRVSLQEAAVASVEDRLTLFPLTGDESVEIPHGDERLTMFVRQISTHYPLVIIDTGPLTSDDAHLFESEAACPIDTAIVVRDLRSAAEKMAMTTAQRLQRGGIQAVGIAENFHATE